MNTENVEKLKKEEINEIIRKFENSIFVILGDKL